MEETEVQTTTEETEIQPTETEVQPGARGVPDAAQKAARLEREISELKQRYEATERENQFYRNYQPEEPPPQQQPQFQQPIPQPTQDQFQREIQGLRAQGYHEAANRLERQGLLEQGLQATMAELEQMKSYNHQQRQAQAWDAAIGLAKKDVDLSGEPDEIKSLVDSMFFASYGSQLIDPRTGRIALDPRTLQAHYGKVAKLIQDSHEAYHQRKLKNKDERIRAAEGVMPEKGSGPTISEIKPKQYPSSQEIHAIAAKTGKSIKEVVAEIDEKFLA